MPSVGHLDDEDIGDYEKTVELNIFFAVLYAEALETGSCKTFPLGQSTSLNGSLIENNGEPWRGKYRDQWQAETLSGLFIYCLILRFSSQKNNIFFILSRRHLMEPTLDWISHIVIPKNRKKTSRDFKIFTRGVKEMMENVVVFLTPIPG